MVKEHRLREEVFLRLSVKEPTTEKWRLRSGKARRTIHGLSSTGNRPVEASMGDRPEGMIPRRAFLSVASGACAAARFGRFADRAATATTTLCRR